MIASLTTTFILTTTYALLISIPIVRAVEEDMMTRWMITAGGVALVLVSAAWNGPVDMLTLFVHFGVASVPFWIRSTVYHLEAERRRRLEDVRRGHSLQPVA